MGEPKLHHYVPQFHLRRFADCDGRLWIWDRDRDRLFPSSPGSIAAEKHFYLLNQYEALGHDPMTMERQLSSLEGEVALITGQWLDWLREMEPLQQVEIPAPNREIVGLFLAVQHLRTADTRDILAALAAGEDGQPISPLERRYIHTEALWDEKLVNDLAQRFSTGHWIFARNDTATPLITSDNPISFRTGDNRLWCKASILAEGVYLVFALAPDIMFYAYPDEPKYKAFAKFDSCLSPVVFSDEMAESENSGQVFMATRFVISNRNNFKAERAFAPTIGTMVLSVR